VTLAPFDGNAYRKRVLSAVDARGGPEQSDPFELYDLPVDDALSDAEVAARMEAVWAFWQKQRDHPKYRGVVTAMLGIHRDISGQMRSAEGRRWLADRTRVERAARDEQRYAVLDAALARLVQRFGGVPADKVHGLRGLAAGVTEAEFEVRLRRHRLLSPSAPATEAVLRQVRDDLDELGQLDGTPPPASLYDLLGLPPTAAVDEVRAHRDRLAARNRELRPDRRRALIDDLLAAVSALLVNADPARYLDDLRRVVLERLRPRVAAAVLVEDELTAQDHRHLLREAQAAGLDRERALAVLSQLAGEFGVPVRSSPEGPAPAPVSVPVSSPQARWQAALSEARAALRDGRARVAQGLVDRARTMAGGMLPPIRAVGDEVAEILTEADQRWRAALSSAGGRRYVEAVATLQRLVAIARDVPGPQGQDAVAELGAASGAVAAADQACAAASARSGPARELGLMEVLAAVGDHGAAREELSAVGVAPARAVRVVSEAGSVTVHWEGSPSPGPVDYRVLRLLSNGGTRAVGVTRGTSLEDGSPGGAEGYVVIARRAGIAAAEARSDRPDPAPVAEAPLPPMVDSLSVVPMGRRLRLVYTPPVDGRAEVRRLAPGVPPPAPGTRADPAHCGVLVPGMGPGLAVDSRPVAQVTDYVVLTVDADAAVVGAAAAYVDLPPVTDLTGADGRLRWTWPLGCTEVLVVTRPDAPPLGPTDPAATVRKVTNMRYDMDDGATVDGPCHVAVFPCTRIAGQLRAATRVPDGARTRLG